MQNMIPIQGKKVFNKDWKDRQFLLAPLASITNIFPSFNFCYFSNLPLSLFMTSPSS